MLEFLKGPKTASLFSAWFWTNWEVGQKEQGWRGQNITFISDKADTGDHRLCLLMVSATRCPGLVGPCGSGRRSREEFICASGHLLSRDRTEPCTPCAQLHICHPEEEGTEKGQQHYPGGAHCSWTEQFGDHAPRRVEWGTKSQCLESLARKRVQSVGVRSPQGHTPVEWQRC